MAVKRAIVLVAGVLCRTAMADPMATPRGPTTDRMVLMDESEALAGDPLPLPQWPSRFAAALMRVGFDVRFTVLRADPDAMPMDDLGACFVRELGLRLHGLVVLRLAHEQRLALEQGLRLGPHVAVVER